MGLAPRAWGHPPVHGVTIHRLSRVLSRRGPVASPHFGTAWRGVLLRVAGSRPGRAPIFAGRGRSLRARSVSLFARNGTPEPAPCQWRCDPCRRRRSRFELSQAVLSAGSGSTSGPSRLSSFVLGVSPLMPRTEPRCWFSLHTLGSVRSSESQRKENTAPKVRAVWSQPCSLSHARGVLLCSLSALLLLYSAMFFYAYGIDRLWIGYLEVVF